MIVAPDIAYFILGFAFCTVSMALGFYLGRAYGTAATSRVISPRTPLVAPSMARRAERIALQAIKSDPKRDRVISPGKKAATRLDIEA